MTARAGRLDIGIVGGGRVGPVLGAALNAAGHTIVGVATVSERNRERIEAMLPDVPILELPELLERSDLVILAIPESALPALVSGLAAAGHWRAGQLVLHTAPGLGCEVLAPAASVGAIPLAVHPAMSFTGTSVDLVRLREANCAVTSPAPVLPIAQALVIELGAEPVVIAEQDRSAYAEAIATATDFSAAIVAQATGILAGIGVEAPGAMLGPVVRSAVENALAATVAATIDLSSLPQDEEDAP